MIVLLLETQWPGFSLATLLLQTVSLPFPLNAQILVILKKHEETNSYLIL
jgi:hypothetical protein